MADQPNVLFLMDDQHRADWLGCAGASWLPTPHIDALASRGIRFSQATTTCPVCAPSRIGLASGIRPSRLGALDNDGVLPPQVPTFYQHFRDHGYRVGCVGKLDLLKGQNFNGREGRRPETYSWGFTDPLEIEGKMHAGRFSTPQGPYGQWLADQGLYEGFLQDYQRREKTGWVKGALEDSVLPEEAFSDVYIARESIAKMEHLHASGYPWYLLVSFVGPHNPFDPPTSWAEKFRQADIPDPIDPEGEALPEVRKLTRGLTIEEHRIARRQYAANIALIDHWVGELLQALDHLGATDNTLIVFCSDHGEMLGDHGRYTKSVPYEASIQVPMIIAGPGVSTGVSDALVEMQDIHPTLTDLTGLPKLSRIDAKSFATCCEDPGADHREHTYCEHRGFRVIRTREWKLVLNDQAPEELYDLTRDPGEQTNVASEHPTLIAQMRDRRKQHEGRAWWLD